MLTPPVDRLSKKRGAGGRRSAVLRQRRHSWAEKSSERWVDLQVVAPFIVALK